MILVYLLYYLYFFFKKYICFFVDLLILNKVDKVSVNIREYSQIFINFLNVRKTGYPYFSESKQIEKSDIYEVRKNHNTEKYGTIQSVPTSSQLNVKINFL